MDCASKKRKSEKRIACSISLRSRSLGERARFNSSTHVTEAFDRPLTSPTRTRSRPPKRSALRLKARPNARRTRTSRNRWLGCAGLLLVLAAGIAITNRRVQKPYAQVGPNLPNGPPAMRLHSLNNVVPLIWLNKMCESRSPSGEMESHRTRFEIIESHQRRWALPFLADEFKPFVLGENNHAEAPGLVEFRPSARACDHVVGLF